MAVGDEYGPIEADEVLEIDNLQASKVGAEDALRVALNFHANRISLLQRDLMRLWRDLGQKHNFVMGGPAEFKLERRKGTTYIVEVEPRDPATMPWVLQGDE